MTLIQCNDLNDLQLIINKIEDKKYNFIDMIQGELGYTLMVLCSFGKHFIKNVGTNNVILCNKGHSYLYKNYGVIIIEINLIDNKKLEKDTLLKKSAGHMNNYYNYSHINIVDLYNTTSKFKSKWLTIFEGIYWPSEIEKKNNKHLCNSNTYNCYGIINYAGNGIWKYTSGNNILEYKTGDRNDFNNIYNLYKIRSDDCLINDKEKYNIITIYARKSYKNNTHNFDYELLIKLIDLFQKYGIKVVIFEDIFKYEYPDEYKNNLLEIINMDNYFDVEKYINITQHSLMHFGTQTGASEILLYYNSLDFINCDKSLWNNSILDYNNMCQKKGKKFYNIWELSNTQIPKNTYCQPPLGSNGTELKISKINIESIDFDSLIKIIMDNKKKYNIE
jgi:hypothetical protein